LEQIKPTYARETARCRTRFKTLLADADFQAGLLLSSRSLFGALPEYVAGDDAAPTAKDEHVERGLMRYLSRMAMKATPFGTFCAVVAGRFVARNGDAEVARFAGDPVRKRSFVRLNKALYGFLMEHLKRRPAVRRRLPLELNPTLQEDGPRLLFLTAIGGREVFQRLDRNAVVDLVASVVGERTGATLDDLVAALATDDRIEAEEPGVRAYVDRLVSLGFLRFRPGIREQDPDWDLPLRTLLESIEDEHAALVAVLLSDLRAATERYATAEVKERARLLEQVRGRITEALGAMDARTPLGRKPPFYEDASAEARLDLAVDLDRSQAFRDLTEYTSLTLCAAWPRGEQATMRHFFDTFYGPDHDGIPLLRFYEDFYREHFKAHLERERRGRRPPAPEENQDEDKAEDYNLANPFGLELIKSIHAAQARVRQLVERRCREALTAEAISVSAAELAEALDLPPRPAACRSLSLFAQLVPTGGGDAHVVLPNGRYLAGYGKYFSRFLYTLPDEVSRRAYRENLALTEEYLAEICGDAAFNANLHPPLLRWEISYPTGEAGQLERQLSSADLEVRRDPADRNALCICHRPTGTPVIPVDLGFLNPRMRPPLYQLLSQFGPPVNFGFPLPPIRPMPPHPPVAAEPKTPEGLADGAPAQPDGPEATPAVSQPVLDVVYRPRIVFGKRLVLTRRSWSVPHDRFPRWPPGTQQVDFLLAVHRWRRQYGIPEQVYVRVYPGPAPRKKPAPDARPADAVAKAVPDTPAPPGPGTNAEAGHQAIQAAALPPQAERKAPPGGWTVSSRDFAKPQFIDFGNPQLVALFGRMTGALERFDVTIEECFPMTDALLRAGDDAFATELILQVDYPQNGGGPGVWNEGDDA
jgi:hypothetical protein